MGETVSLPLNADAGQYGRTEGGVTEAQARSQFAGAYRTRDLSSSSSSSDSDESEELNDVATSAVRFFETEHGRLRRKQRGIDKKDLQAAIKYGTKKKGRRASRVVYTYNDIVYVTDQETGEEVTSYAKVLELQAVPITSMMQMEHDDARSRIKLDKDSWLSNTVIVIDTSGSMRESDVWGAKTRLSAVWIAIALDFIAERLESGTACPMDVVSIVTLDQGSKVIIRQEPCSWVLYNKIVSFYTTDCVKPSGHGAYLPSLLKAEELLTRNSNASCALALVFLSDGRPSDAYVNKSIDSASLSSALDHRVGELSKRFGRRLTFAAVGIGSPDNFPILKEMVAAASDHGANGIFWLPSLTSTSIGSTFTSVATSLASTQLEMMNPNSKKQQKVREVSRESRKKAAKPITSISAPEFSIYKLGQVERTCYTEWFEGSTRKHKFDVIPLKHPAAIHVAVCEEAFGEGAERLAFRLYEVAADKRTIVGAPLVAKASRLLFEDGVIDTHGRKKFAQSFCRTQQLALRLASEFNAKLRSIPCVHEQTPRVSFLDCSIYQVDDSEFGKVSLLVEERLDETKWHKWNANNGYVEGMEHKPKFTQERIRRAIADLDTIREADDEEEEEDSQSLPSSNAKKRTRELVVAKFTPSDVAQAFSHFTYWATGRKRVVCDLQGVYDEASSQLRLSDPVIHYYNHMRTGRRHVHGRTDGGRQGCAKFFDTHECNGLCKLVTRGFKEAQDVHRKRQEEPPPPAKRRRH